VRDEQARRTRRAIVTAAHDLFLAQGYAATTIDGIAEAAHVSRRTVFNSVGGKAALLKLALDWAIVGDDEPIALADRPAIKAILSESDPRKALMLWVQTVAEVAARTAPLGEVLIAAADIDPAAAQLLAEASRNRMLGATMFIRYLASLDGTLLGAHGRPPLPAAGRSAQLEHRRLQPMAVRQPRGCTAAYLNGAAIQRPAGAPKWSCP
jgi:AcrR family transcriptional regulator